MNIRKEEKETKSKSHNRDTLGTCEGQFQKGIIFSLVDLGGRGRGIGEVGDPFPFAGEGLVAGRLGFKGRIYLDRHHSPSHRRLSLEGGLEIVH